MSKELVISATPHETRVAIVEDGLLCEIYIEREKEFALVGSLYKGRVTRVLPGMQSAFVDIGLDSDAFLYVGDFLEHLEEYDHVPAPVEKPQRVQQQGGEVFPPSTTHGGVNQESYPASQPNAAASEPPGETIPPVLADEARSAGARIAQDRRCSRQPLLPGGSIARALRDPPSVLGAGTGRRREPRTRATTR